MNRSEAIERITAMRYDNQQTWDLSEKDKEALRHAVQAFSDADRLRAYETPSAVAWKILAEKAEADRDEWKSLAGDLRVQVKRISGILMDVEEGSFVSAAEALDAIRELIG